MLRSEKVVMNALKRHKSHEFKEITDAASNELIIFNGLARQVSSQTGKNLIKVQICAKRELNGS